MARFITGDELGNIKVLRYTLQPEPKSEVQTLYPGTTTEKPSAIQALSLVHDLNGDKLLTAAYADGSGSVFSLKADDAVEKLQEWKENRLKSGNSFVGLTISERVIHSCTSNGALRMTPVSKNGDQVIPSIAVLPTRLSSWKMTPDAENFAYGGDEVDLSVWNTENTFDSAVTSPASQSSIQKRKRRKEFAGEIWRANNVTNDSLGLRQPIRITSLTFLPTTSAGHQLLTGTQLGDVRRYDTRAGRRPVADWKNVGKLGGVRVVEKGLSEHEVFVSDHGCNLLSIDLRNGRTVYGYKGLSGAVTSIAPAPTLMASTALDRFSRIHSTFPPSSEAGNRQDNKGEVLDKIFMKSTPTVVIWDQDIVNDAQNQDDDKGEGDVWDGMEHIDDSDDNQTSSTRKKKQRKN